MNENQPPLEIHPDEHLEARITAYVLGEASPFEAAEIESLIEKSPELKLFANRTRTLNKLLKEAETKSSSTDSNWKLSADRRATLEPVLGPVPTLVPHRENRIRRASFRAAIGIAAVLLLTVFSAPMVIRQRKKADQAPNLISDIAFLNSLQSEGLEKGTDQLKRAVREKEDASEITGFTHTAEKSKQATASSSQQKKAIASNTASPTQVPIPDLAPTEPTVNFGDGDDLGAGWGGEKSATAERQSKINIGGQVSKPGAQDFKEGLTLQEAVVRAGGATEFGSRKRVKLFRDGEIQTYDISDNEIAQIELQPGDSIEMPQKNWLGCGASRDETIASKQNAKPAATPAPANLTAFEITGTDRAENSLGRASGGGFAGNEIIDNDLLSGRDTSITKAQQLRKTGKYDEARELLEQAESSAPTDARIKQELDYLDDPVRTNPALTYEHTKNVDEVRRNLYEAEGNLELGKYDDAKKAYQDTLRIDPYNSTGRRGMERIAAAQSDYYRAAYDHTRSELLMQVDKAWELSVPADAEAKDSDWGFDTLSDSKQQPSETARLGYLKLDNRESTLEMADLFGENKDAADSSLYPTESANAEITLEIDPQLTEFEGFTNYGNPVTKTPLLGDLPITGSLFREKQIDLADLSEEIPATQEPFSTFSLNISDASFQVASSAVAKGERPDPDSIKPEQFYNAVSYDDPAPSTGEPVAAAIGQVAHPVIPGRNLVRMSVRTASTGRAATQPLVLTLLVDQSGSMARADRRAAMETALTQLATLMQPDDRITVIGFSRTPSLLADSLPGNDAEKLPDIINQASSEGGTNIEQALNLAENLALRHKVDGAQNRIVLFTDGAANLGNADPDRLAERVKNLRQQDLAFDIAGIGTDDINDRLLSELSRHGNGRYYLVGENTATSLAKQLAGAFRPAAENVKIQVKFNPQRVGNYKLIGFEKDRLKTEDFRNDSVDAAELAADESGTALYQVEPLPQGSGEIGELFVRFRDTASGEMVERSWTIPYESQAPAIDNAQPQMQLATLSLLAAQKLQTGPLADAINFRDLAPTIAAVKQAYARSPQAQQMITLINALK